MAAERTDIEFALSAAHSPAWWNLETDPLRQAVRVWQFAAGAEVLRTELEAVARRKPITAELAPQTRALATALNEAPASGRVLYRGLKAPAADGEYTVGATVTSDTPLSFSRSAHDAYNAQYGAHTLLHLEPGATALELGRHSNIFKNESEWLTPPATYEVTSVESVDGITVVGMRQHVALPYDVMSITEAASLDLGAIEPIEPVGAAPDTLTTDWEQQMYFPLMAERQVPQPLLGVLQGHYGPTLDAHGNGGDFVDARIAALDRLVRSIDLQPVIVMATGATAGFEALARYHAADGTAISPAVVLEDARDAGHGREFEDRALDDALGLLPSIPDGAWLEVNVGNESLAAWTTTRRLQAAAANGIDLSRVIVDVTAAANVNRAALRWQAEAMAEIGVRIALDNVTDLGNAEASSTLEDTVAAVRPAMVKIAASEVAAATDDPLRASAITDFMARVGVISPGTQFVAVGADAAACDSLGIGIGQSFALGAPGPPHDVIKNANIAAVEQPAKLTAPDIA